MHLEALTIKNFRKFKAGENTIRFVGSDTIETKSSEDERSSSIAPSSTLMVGKNNAGKTTVSKALNFVCNKSKPRASDFNIGYLRGLLQEYIDVHSNSESFDSLPTPELEFDIQVSIKLDEKEGDLVNNLYQFLSISAEPLNLINIKIKYALKEEQSFKDKVQTILLDEYPDIEEPNLQLGKQLEKLYEYLNDDETIYNIAYCNESGVEVKDPSLNRLFNIKEIKANRYLKEGVLSEIYKKIISSQYTNNTVDKGRLNESIEKINNEIDITVGPKSESISTILNEIEHSSHVGVGLSGNVKEETILRNLIRYSFSDGGDYIPEEQFGLGYINLLNIIGEIIHYIDSYEDKSHQNQINLLFIEEPEAFMHPQMQEFFINRIDNAVNKALQLAETEEGSSAKTLRCQLVITTHSSHIVNSKIHSSNSFNNINYLCSYKREASVINLNDKLISGGDENSNKSNLKFIKKHIKYKVSELFFSDAVIFVEGVTEDTLLHYFLDLHSKLKNYYISIFNINGAHGKLYFPLAKALKIPCLIITDTDIKRAPCEKGIPNHEKEESCSICDKTANIENIEQYIQVTSLEDRVTTNATLVEFNKSINDVDDEDANYLSKMDYFEDGNLYVIFQKDPIEGQYSTSFEEALILSNFENEILNRVLEDCKPQIYSDIVKSGEAKITDNLIENSFKLQKKLSDSKSDFANSLLYECIISDQSSPPTLPLYIEDGFSWLSNQLNPELEAEVEDDTVA